MLQGVALLLYLVFDGLTSLYVISALFGLFQGGIVPSYAIIVREYFPPREAGDARRHRDHGDHPRHGARRLDVGVIFDLTGSYRVAFLNGMLWNLLNMSIVLWLLFRPRWKIAATA